MKLPIILGALLLFIFVATATASATYPSFVYACTQTGGINVYTPDAYPPALTLYTSIIGDGTTPVDFAVSSTGIYAYVAYPTYIDIIDIGKASRIATINIPRTITSIAINPNNRNLYVAYKQDSNHRGLYVLDTVNRTLSSAIAYSNTSYVGQWNTMTVSPSGATLYIGDTIGKILPFNIAAQTYGADCNLGGIIKQVEVSGAGDVYVTNGNSNVYKYNSALTYQGAFGFVDTVTAFSLSTTAQNIYVATTGASGNYSRRVDQNQVMAQTVVNFMNSSYSMAVSPNNGYAYYASTTDSGIRTIISNSTGIYDFLLSTPIDRPLFVVAQEVYPETSVQPSSQTPIRFIVEHHMQRPSTTPYVSIWENVQGTNVLISGGPAYGGEISFPLQYGNTYMVMVEDWTHGLSASKTITITDTGGYWLDVTNTSDQITVYSYSEISSQYTPTTVTLRFNKAGKKAYYPPYVSVTVRDSDGSIVGDPSYPIDSTGTVSVNLYSAYMYNVTVNVDNSIWNILGPHPATQSFTLYPKDSAGAVFWVEILENADDTNTSFRVVPESQAQSIYSTLQVRFTVNHYYSIKCPSTVTISSSSIVQSAKTDSQGLVSFTVNSGDYYNLSILYNGTTYTGSIVPTTSDYYLEIGANGFSDHSINVVSSSDLMVDYPLKETEVIANTFGWNNKFPGVDVYFYSYPAGVLISHGVTDAVGSYVTTLVGNKQYRMYVVNTTSGESLRDQVVYGIQGSLYLNIMPQINWNPLGIFSSGSDKHSYGTGNQYADINFDVQSNLDGDDAVICINYTDESRTTSALNYYLYLIDGRNHSNRTLVNSGTFTFSMADTNMTNCSFTQTDARGNVYVLTLVPTSSAYPNLKQSFSIDHTDPIKVHIPGFDPTWYAPCGIIILAAFACFFGQQTIGIGGLVISFVGWGEEVAGWMTQAGVGWALILSFITVFSIVMIFRQKQKEVFS